MHASVLGESPQLLDFKLDEVKGSLKGADGDILVVTPDGLVVISGGGDNAEAVVIMEDGQQLSMEELAEKLGKWELSAGELLTLLDPSLTDSHRFQVFNPNEMSIQAASVGGLGGTALAMMRLCQLNAVDLMKAATRLHPAL